MEVVVFFLIVYGIANIMIFSTIFSRWRSFWERVSPNFFGVLFNCMICLPFWIGIFLSITVFSVTHSNFEEVPIYFAWFLDGCLASGGVWLMHSVQERLERDG